MAGKKPSKREKRQQKSRAVQARNSWRIRISTWLGGKEQRRLMLKPAARWSVLIVGLLLIGVWQNSFARSHEKLDRNYALRASSGIHQQTRLLYFLYFKGLFPVATEVPDEDLEKSLAGADSEIAENGDKLLTEVGHSTRYGELGKTYLYLPSIWRNGWDEEPNMRVASGTAFAVALMGLFLAFWLIRRPVLGTFLVIFIGSNPFQLFEIYGRQHVPTFWFPDGHDNIFCWVIITATAVLALNLPLFSSGQRKLYRWCAPVLTGILVATIGTLRSEPVALVGTAAFCYLFVAHKRSWPVRIGMLVVLLAAFSLTSRSWGSFFKGKIKAAEQVVEEAGGHVYPGPRDINHLFWHPIWVGLADFDLGTDWKDHKSSDFALPILKEQYDIEIPKIVVQKGTTFERAYKPWDEAGKFYRQAHELDHFGDVLRDDLIERIKKDPLWYPGILFRRSKRVLSESTPIRLAWGTSGITIPFSGWLVLPFLGLLVWCRSWVPLATILVLAGTSATAVAVFSGGNTAFYSTFHIAAMAAICSCAVEAILKYLRTTKQEQAARG